MRTPVRPIKALGQHFLNNPATAAAIASSLIQTDAYNQILEIGPGTGVLTQHLLEKSGKKLFCIDVDERSANYLEEHYPQLHGSIIHGDFLNDPLTFLGAAPFAVIGNFPYNISSQILFRVLDFYVRVPELVGMFQMEVARRITTGPGSKEYGILSVLLQAHYEMEYLFTVPPSEFIPPPKVQSGVIRMTLKKDHLLKCNPAWFKQIVKTAFNQRRKTLRNSIRTLLPADYSSVPYLGQRPEQLHFKQFEELAVILKPLKKPE